MAEGYIELTLEKIQTAEGISELNRMLRFLFNNVPGDGITIRDLSGYGTPESAVVAGVGSTFRRLNGGANTTLYVKESGTAATGWVAK